MVHGDGGGEADTERGRALVQLLLSGGGYDRKGIFAVNNMDFIK